MKKEEIVCVREKELKEQGVNDEMSASLPLKEKFDDVHAPLSGGID